MIAIPEPIHFGQNFPMRLGEIILNHREAKDATNDQRRRVMGFPLPEWQRPLVWSESQKMRFIESIWLGMPLGTYTLNFLEAGHPLDGLVIDGQQRLAAIEDYVEDRLVVFGGRWSDVSIEDQRRFKATTFARYETRSYEEDFLRRYYDLMNFGGVPHEQDQRASVDADLRDDGLAP